MSFGLLLLFICSYFLRFTARLPGLGAVRFDMLLYLILAILALSQSRGQVMGESYRVPKSLGSFFWCIILSVPLAMWPGSAVKDGLPNFLKSVLFFYTLLSL